MPRAHVTYVLDEGFLRCTLVSLYSVLSHRPDAEIQLFFTAPIPKSQAPLSRLRAAFPAADIVATDLPPMDAGLVARGHVSASTLGRLFLPDLLDRKTLYLDGDTLVRRDIGPLFGIDLGGKPVAAVLDAGIQKALWYEKRRLRFRSRKSRQHLGDLKKIAHLVDSETYFNAGIILFDLPRIRELGLDTRMKDASGAMALRKEYGLRFNDQNWLNALFRGQVHFLPPEWNALWGNNLTGRRPFPAAARAAYESSRRDPAIVHFVGRTKPWNLRWPWLHPKRQPWASEYHRVEAAFSALAEGTAG